MMMMMMMMIMTIPEGRILIMGYGDGLTIIYLP